jgi:hypothetical protein
MKHNPAAEPERTSYSKLISVFEDLDRQCQERSSKIASEAKEALGTQLTTWITSREKLYLTQLRDASEQFRKTTLAAVKERQAAEYSQALANEKAKFADEYYVKLREIHDEREQFVQRRIELARQMEEAAATARQHSVEEETGSKAAVEANNEQHEAITMQIHVADNTNRFENEIEAADKEARDAKKELAAAVFAHEGALSEISSLKTELQAVHLKLAQEEKKENLSDTERTTLIERAEVAEAAAMAAVEAKKELERCTAAAQVARTAAESQASHLRHRLEELIKENNTLQTGMLAAEEAVRAASTSEKATAADRAVLVEKLAATKEALATHRAAITQLESQLKQERTHSEKLQTIAESAAALQTEAAAWEEKTLRHAEDTRLRLAAALRDIEAVCLAARALGQCSSSTNSKFTAPLLHTIKETEENAADAASWLRRAQIEGKTLASSAPFCPFSLQ